MGAKAGRSKETVRDIARINEQNVWKLRAEFKTQNEIAVLTGLDQSTVSKILTRLSAKANLELPREIASVKMQQAMQLDFIASEAMAAWQRSKENSKKTRMRTTTGGKSARNKVEDKALESATREGDSRYLTTAMKALSDVRDIFGLNAPQKFDIALAIMERFMQVAKETNVDPEEALNDYIEVLVIEHQRLGAGGGDQDAIPEEAE